ncbi:MAG: hypothetical protein EBR82_41885 [Caulobacteraceae bacterium]|nr:hypothetical protein [Caulobacteraceae bacterium]
MIDYEGQYPNSRRYFKNDYENLKFKFSGSENIENNYSQSMQDMFVLSILDGKRNGVYVEVGADKPRVINNSYLLESQYDWEGVSFEIESDKVDYFNTIRKNKCICANATKFDYKSLFDERKYPKQIDYLQLDCDPPQITLECLKKLPLEDYRFSVITFETDLYSGGQDVQIEHWQILSSLGYQRVIKNIKNEGNPYEDWWIDPLVIGEHMWKQFLNEDVEFSEVILKCY